MAAAFRNRSRPGSSRIKEDARRKVLHVRYPGREIPAVRDCGYSLPFSRAERASRRARLSVGARREPRNRSPPASVVNNATLTQVKEKVR